MIVKPVTKKKHYKRTLRLPDIKLFNINDLEYSFSNLDWNGTIG